MKHGQMRLLKNKITAKRQFVGDSIIGCIKAIDSTCNIASFYRDKTGPFLYAQQPFLLSRGKRSIAFFTNDSRRYALLPIYPHFNNDAQIERRIFFDSVVPRFFQQNQKNTSPACYKRGLWRMHRAFFGFRSSIESISENITFLISPSKAISFSIIGAILFGMISMSIIYRYFGQGAYADSQFLGLESVSSENKKENSSKNLFSYNELQNTHYIESELITSRFPIAEQKSKEEFEKIKENELFAENAKNMTRGYPIEKMLPYILEQDREVAAYLVAIAKKESNWGKRIPVLKGEDCFNYWGYRGIRENMGTNGHTCFDNPKDAVQTVAKRLTKLIQEEKMTTAKDLIVWKCGYSCSGHGKSDVNKWISDVALYYNKLKKTKNS